MPESHFQTLYDYYPDVIAQMPPDFTSHEFILRLFQQHQEEFVEALYVYRTDVAPMRQVTSRLSRQLHQFQQIRFVGTIPDPDIFGDDSECAKWRRTPTPEE